MTPDELLGLFLPIYEGSVVEIKKKFESYATRRIAARSRSGPRAARLDEDLHVLLGIPERVERGGHTVDAARSRDHRRHVDLALGDRPQRVAELERVVREREHDRELLRLRDERAHACRAACTTRRRRPDPSPARP